MKFTAESLRNTIKHALNEQGLSVASVEKMAGLRLGALKDFLNGKSGMLGADKYSAVVHALNISETATLQIPIVGYAGAGATIHYFDDHALGAGLEYVDMPPGLKCENCVSLVVRGASQQPMLWDNWLVFYSRDCEGVLDECINQPCVVRTTDDRTLIKMVKRGSKPGHYHLISTNAEVMVDEPLLWASRILSIVPR